MAQIENHMPNITPTKQTLLLIEALKRGGVDVKQEHWDGHKHIDIAILDSKIYIEIDGLHHYTSPEQIKADFKREHYSDENGFDTIHIPNPLIETHLEEISKAIIDIVKERKI